MPFEVEAHILLKYSQPEKSCKSKSHISRIENGLENHPQSLLAIPPTVGASHTIELWIMPDYSLTVSFLMLAKSLAPNP